MKLFTIAVVIVGLISNSTSNDIANRIKNRYNSIQEKCFDSTNKAKPAYECSGIMIRGVRTDLKIEFAWDMKDLNKEKDAFSLAYLRSDQVFSRFPRDYDSGFIVYPHLETPSEKNKYKVFCSFPMDAHADGREGHGCGKSKSDKTNKSSHCGKQNIKSFEDWKSHFMEIMNSRDNNFVIRQCSFDMTTESAATGFEVSLKANIHIQAYAEKYAFRNNELRMHAWDETNAKNIPIEAFFYLIGSTDGLNLAEKYQDEYFARSDGEIVPIVGIRLPTSQVSFELTYHERTPQIRSQNEHGQHHQHGHHGWHGHHGGPHGHHGGPHGHHGGPHGHHGGPHGHHGGPHGYHGGPHGHHGGPHGHHGGPHGHHGGSHGHHGGPHGHHGGPHGHHGGPHGHHGGPHGHHGGPHGHHGGPHGHHGGPHGHHGGPHGQLGGPHGHHHQRHF